MVWLETLFWVGAACVANPYLVYPFALGIVAKVKQRRSATAEGGPLPTVSVVLAAYNEEATIERRLGELMGLIAASGIEGEVIVASDGSTDRTTDRACAWSLGEARVRVVASDANRGKAAALTDGCALARNEIIVFADTRQSWAPDALACLMANFQDPGVGAVSGELIVESAPGVMAGVRLCWRFEKWLRRQESAVSSTVGVTGAISAVHRLLFRPIPPGTILDDVYWPLGVAMQGYRVVFDHRARAYDRLPEQIQDEFRRKVRTLSGNYQLLGRLPAALSPTRNPVWFQSLLAMLGASAALPGPIYRLAFWGQIEFYLLATIGLCQGVGARFRPASAAASFVVLNAAAWLAFWVWASGRTTRLWHKTHYCWSALEGVPR